MIAIIIGPGFDTLSLIPYHNDVMNQNYNHPIMTYEIDFPDIINKKVNMIKSDEEIMTMLNTYDHGINNNNNSSSGSDGSSSSSSSSLCDKVTRIGPITYISENLCNIDSIIDILTTQCNNFNKNIPTLIISECCLVYIKKESVLQLCLKLSQLLNSNNNYHHHQQQQQQHHHHNDVIWFSYDMINPNDIYGKQMSKNLTLAGFQIPGFHDFPTLHHQSQRFLQDDDDEDTTKQQHNNNSNIDNDNKKWHDANSFTMRTYYEKYIHNEEKKRLKTLELFDEIEEFNLLMDHYSFTVATIGNKFKSIMKL